MAFKIINRNDGFVVLPDGEKIERHNFTIVDRIDSGYTRMEKTGLISIHQYFKGEVKLPEIPEEGACFINGDRSYKFSKGSWEEKEVKPPLLPVKLKSGHQLHTEDRIYERQGKIWVVLAGEINVPNIKESSEISAKKFSETRFTPLTAQTKTTFRISPEDGSTLLMIEITGTDLVQLAQDAYDLTQPSGRARMLGEDKNGVLGKTRARKIVDSFKNNETIALHMGKIDARDCRLTVYRDGKALLIESNWIGHTPEDMKTLLERQNINL